MDINKVISITEDLSFTDLTNELKQIAARSSQENCPIVLPLVGEFSSGKTTLINALTDSKKLETATKPTTSTIYEVHFGCDSCYANVIDNEGNIVKISDMGELKNSQLADFPVVEVFDTSTRISPSTILVDTPGLSSSDARHKQALVNFLPQADGILLVSDINQQLTRSLTDFMESIKLSRRPAYLILTKCDTKSEEDIEKARQYVCANSTLAPGNIVCVSALKDDMSELYALLDSVQKEKGKILEEVNGQRVAIIVKEVLRRIDELLTMSFSDKDTDEALCQKQAELNRMKRRIDRLIESLQTDIDEAGRNVARKFQDKVFERLDTIIANKSQDYNADAVEAINSLSSLLLNEYKSEIKAICVRNASRCKDTDDALDLRCLADMDMSKYSINGTGFNLDLNSLGHQYDGWISTGVKLAAAATVVWATAATLSGAAAATGALNAGKIIDVADTASDIGSIISNHKTARRIEKAARLTKRMNEQYDSINKQEEKYTRDIGASKGMIESMVGFVTDCTWGKPQRRRAIHQYIDDVLLPGIQSETKRISAELVRDIQTLLYGETEAATSVMVNAINDLKNNRQTKQKAFEEKMEKLRDCKNILLTL